MIKISSQLLELFKDPSTLSLVLGSAGASGLAGGYLSSKAKGPKNETPKERRRRIMRNALITAGMGGGAAAAGVTGMKALHNALPADDVSPVSQAINSPASRGAMALGTFGLLNRNYGKEEIQAQKSLLSTLKGVAASGSNDPKIKALLSSINPDGTGLSGNFAKNREAFMKLLQANGGSAADIHNALLNAGLPIHPGQDMNTVFRNRGETLKHRLFGTNSELARVSRLNPRTRTALSAAAVFAPELLSGITGALSGD